MTGLSTCPCCGAPLRDGAGLAVSTATSSLVHEGGVVRLAPQMADFLSALLERRGVPILVDHVALRIWGHGSQPRTYKKAISVYTSHARKVLRPLGFDIYLAGRRGDSTLTLERAV